MAAVKGYVEKIKYRNEDNGYSVLSVTGADDGEEYILVGNFSYISEGELVEAAGRMTEHPIYGEQLAVESYELKEPEDTVSMERYLGSGAIKGIGAALATRIVKNSRRIHSGLWRKSRNGWPRLKESARRWRWQSGSRSGRKRTCARR